MSPNRDQRLNVLFMQSQTYFGADSAVHALLMRHLDRRSVSVHVACNQGRPEEPSKALAALSDIPDLNLRKTDFGTSLNERSPLNIVRQTVKYGASFVKSQAGLVAYARANRIHVIHCTEKPRDAFYGFLLARAVGARCVIHLHVKAENWISPLVRWAMHQADLLLGVSEFVADSIVELGYPRAKTRYLLNALDLERFKTPAAVPGERAGENIRREFEIGSDEPLMAVVSRLFTWKGHVDLIRSLALVRREVPAFRLLVVGEDDPRGNPGGGSFMEELQRLVAELDLGQHVIFTGFRKDVPDIMAACDVYTMPSFEEPFGMVYLEAMAYSKPVVALDNGGAREIVQHGRTGLLSPVKDLPKLAENIVTLLKDRELALRMGEAGRQLLVERFGPVRMARDLESIYRDLLGWPAAGAS